MPWIVRKAVGKGKAGGTLGGSGRQESGGCGTLASVPVQSYLAAGSAAGALAGDRPPSSFTSFE
jgi:hypothetical protein